MKSFSKLAQEGKDKMNRIIYPGTIGVNPIIFSEILEAIEKKKQGQHSMGAIYEMLDNPRFTADVLLQQFTGLLLAGHDTTAHTMSFVLGALANNPEVCWIEPH